MHLKKGKYMQGLYYTHMHTHTHAHMHACYAHAYTNTCMHTHQICTHTHTRKHVKWVKMERYKKFVFQVTHEMRHSVSLFSIGIYKWHRAGKEKLWYGIGLEKVWRLLSLMWMIPDYFQMRDCDWVCCSDVVSLLNNILTEKLTQRHLHQALQMGKIIVF